MKRSIGCHEYRSRPYGQGKLIEFNWVATASTKATFPDWGVYEVKLTVTDKASGKSNWQHAWINVWDARSHILKDEKPDPLFAALIQPLQLDTSEGESAGRVFI